MQIKGSRKTIESVTIEVSPQELANELGTALLRTVGLGDGTYINSDGVVEHWENGPGSGFTTRFDKATQEQKLVSKFVDDLHLAIRRLK